MHTRLRESVEEQLGALEVQKNALKPTRANPQSAGGVELLIDVSEKLAVALKNRFPVTPETNPGTTGNCITATIQTTISTVARDSKIRPTNLWPTQGSVGNHGYT